MASMISSRLRPSRITTVCSPMATELRQFVEKAMMWYSGSGAMRTSLAGSSRPGRMNSSRVWMTLASRL